MRSAQVWAKLNYGGAEFGDCRRAARFVEMMAAMASRPGGKVSDVFRSAAQRQGAYDLLEHEGVSAQGVVDVIGDACARACRGQQRVLVVLDGSSLTLTDGKSAKGFGSIGSRKFRARGIKVMNTVALSPQGDVHGVPAQRYWVRAAQAKRGRRKPSERESAHWRLAVDEVAARFARLARSTELHFIADREADASLLFERILSHGHGFTIRANGTRRVRIHGRRVPLRPSLIQQPVLGTMSLRLKASAAGRQRKVTLKLRAAHVPVVLRDHHLHKRSVRELTVVWAREPGRMRRGDRRVEWLLYTTDRALCSKDASDAVERYSRRWRVEEMHKTWKSGACNVETTQLRSPQAVIKWATMLAAVAARIERIKTLSRTSPEQPATVVLSDLEIRALILLKRREKRRTETVSDETPTIGQAARWLGDLGGYVGNRSSGPPGSIVLGRGLERVLIAADVLQELQDQGRLK